MDFNDPFESTVKASNQYIPNQTAATTYDRAEESPFNHYSGSKFSTAQYRNTKKKGYYNKIWPQILWFYRRSLDRV